MISLAKNVGRYHFGAGSLSQLQSALDRRLASVPGRVAYFIDGYFETGDLPGRLPKRREDGLFFVDTSHEPTTEQVDALVAAARAGGSQPIAAVVGIGGGSILDIGKAVANLLTNGGAAADYQGWDLVKTPGTFKIGIPTLSGTGAEASRTCVMMNRAKGLKLGMNSEHTIYDELILDPDLTRSVPRGQYFFTGMDTYVHCVESLLGRHRHAVSDAYSHEALRLCGEIFSDPDMQSDANREKLMVASLLGGSAIANSYVGVVHPLSAGLSMVLGIRHCLANCLVLNVMDEIYPEATETFQRMLALQKIELPRNVCAMLSDQDYRALYDASIVHEKPLANALGTDFRNVLTLERATGLFRRI
jgi:3-deoxy-alpha-D-manno-octulosonate 8-oxidase